MDDEQRKKLYEITKKMSLRASEQMWKYLLVVLGIMIYISYIVLANVFYFPNYRACMERGGTLWSLANAIVHAFFMVCLLGYIARQFVDTKAVSDATLKIYLETFDNYIVQIVGLCVLFLLISYGLLFRRCMNPIACKGCSPAQQTIFNAHVTAQVNRGTPLLRELQQFYRDNMQSGRTRISTCTNYYNSSFRDKGDGAGPTCAVTEGDMPVCQASAYVTNSKDAVQTGPLLSQFFIMTSGCTCVVGNHYDAYMSPVMIKIALDAGARCLDFNITSYSYSKKSFPIVTISRDYDKRNMQHNFVLFEDAMKTLSREWLKNQSGSAKRDPLFIRLTLNAGTTKECMDEIAYLLQYYLNEQHGNHLMPMQWNYKSVDSGGGLGIYPLCAFFDKIVIMIHSPHRSLSDSPLLDGMVNIYSGKGYHKDTACEMVEWKNIKHDNPKERMEKNRLHLTYVETSFHPYSLVGNKQPPDSATKKKVVLDDSLFSLLLNNESINNSAMPPFISGCQFIAMNLQNLDDDLKLYLSVFEKSSFVLKPRSMWPTNMLIAPLPPQNTCDDSTHDAYTKKTDDGSVCYEVCVPKVGTSVKHKTSDSTVQITRAIHATMLSTLTNRQYTKLVKRENACSIASEYQIDAIASNVEPINDEIDLVRKTYHKK